MTPKVLRVLAIACLVFGAGQLVDRLFFIARSQPASGEITAKEATRYTIRYRTAEGRSVELSRSLPTDADERERLKVGQQIALRYQPQSPELARTLGLDFWTFPIGLLLVGALGVFAARYVTSSAPPAGR